MSVRLCVCPSFTRRYSVDTAEHILKSYVIPLPERLRRFILMASCAIETETVGQMDSWTIRLLLQPSVSGVAVSLLVQRITVDILSTFCSVFMVQSEFVVLLFECFVYRQNVACLKRFARYGHWALCR